MTAPRDEVALRPLAGADAQAVQELAASLRRYFSPSDLSQIAQLLRERPSGWVAIDGEGGVVGFLLDAPTSDPKVRELAWMGVTTPLQGHGIGTRLVERMIDSAAAEGVRAIEASTVAESAGYPPYAATRAFYHHRGFVDQRVDQDYYWPGGDRLVLRRTLGDRR